MRVETGRKEERNPEVAGEERVAPSAARLTLTTNLRERVHGETPRTFEPALVAGAFECLDQRVAVPAVPWQIPAPFVSRCAPAAHVSSAPATTSASSR